MSAQNRIRIDTSEHAINIAVSMALHHLGTTIIVSDFGNRNEELELMARLHSLVRFLPLRWEAEALQGDDPCAYRATRRGARQPSQIVIVPYNYEARLEEASASCPGSRWFSPTSQDFVVVIGSMVPPFIERAGCATLILWPEARTAHRDFDARHGGIQQTANDRDIERQAREHM